MEEPESPPTPNTLRPHHISLLMVIMLLYRHYPRKRFHPSFLIQVHRVLLEEVVEVRLLIEQCFSQSICPFR
jgi:anaphase-promoting complex subunit 5